MPYLAKISIYPFKSLDGMDVPQATLLANGALQGDRVFALVDGSGRYINGKRNAKVHHLRSFFDWQNRTLTLHIQGTDHKSVFHVDSEREQLTHWFGTYFDLPVTIQYNENQGYFDAQKSLGPTVICTDTMQTVASWFPGADTQTFASRFRANLEIAGAGPFWEDRLYGENGVRVRFRVGNVLFEGTHPCKRCVVPSRDPRSGQMYPHFQKTFVTKRAELLPSWAPSSPFDHFYRLAANTIAPQTETGKVINVGDEVVLVEDA